VPPLIGRHLHFAVFRSFALAPYRFSLCPIDWRKNSYHAHQMGSLRTNVWGAVLATALLPSAAGGAELTDGPPDALRFLAICAGRLSALTEHQWMFDGPASEITQRQAQDVVELIDAIMPPGHGQRVLGWRIDAKVAHRALLWSAAQNPDPRLAVAAGLQAESLIAPCASLLLG